MGWVIFFILFGSLTLGGYIWFIPYINDQTFIIHYIGIGLTIVCYILAFIIWEYNTATISKYLQKKHGECQTVNTYAYPRKYHYRKPWKIGNKQRDKYEHLYFKVNNDLPLFEGELVKYYKTNPNIKALYGYCLVYGTKYINKDIEKGLALIDEAMNQGSSESYAYKYIIYKEGEGVKKDLKKALKYLEEGVKKESPLAIVSKGKLLHLEGNFKEAEEYFSKAHLLNFNYGNLEKAMLYLDEKAGYKLSPKYIIDSYLLLSPSSSETFYALGLAYENMGKIKKAVKYFDLAAEKGEINSMVMMAQRYIKGDGVPKNLINAAYYLNEARNRENATAYYLTGEAFFEGTIWKKNIDKAISYMEKASDMGHDIAAWYLGTIYQYDLDDNDTAIKYYLIAAEREYPYAYESLGKIYGSIYVREYEKAIKWYLKAYDLGETKLAGEIGYLYLQINKPNEALKYFEKAIKNNDTTIMKLLAKLYSEGQGIYKVDYMKAFNLYQKASLLEDGEAQAFLGAMYMDGKGCSRDLAKSFYWIEKSALNGDARGQSYLSFMYQNGVGTPKDLAKAKYWNDKCEETMNNKYSN